MKILVTGANGFIGNKLCISLANMGYQVHALVRNETKIKWIPHTNITIFKGDILNIESLMIAMKGCKQIYHTAAKVGAAFNDTEAYYNVNVKGTRNVFEAALQNNIEKLVFTSTCAVIGPSNDKALSEETTRNEKWIMDYEISKKKAEDMMLDYIKKGLNIVVVYPSKVYGPGSSSHAFTANATIEKFLKQRIAFIPSPGNYKVSFAYIDDIVSGHILAMLHGRSGEKYILGGINISYIDYFKKIRAISFCKGHIIKVSKMAIYVCYFMQWLWYKITGKAPSFSKNSIDYIFHNYTFTSNKAINELGYKITPLEQALQQTIQFLNSKTKISLSKV